MRWADARGDSFRLVRPRPGAPRGRLHRLLRRPLHGRVGRRAHRRRTSRSSCRTSTPAARWPTWPTSTRVEEAWEALAAVIDIERLVPITYMNSSAALKAFVGRHGGAVCTSSNARAVLEWAFRPEADGGAGGDQVLFFPDQHLGRNTGLAMGFTPRRHAGVGPAARAGRPRPRPTLKEATFLLWKGHCSVHQRFRPEHVAAFRAEHPDGIVVVHPECSHDVCDWPTRWARPTSSSGPSRRRRTGRSSASAPRSTSCNGWTTRRPARRSCRSTRSSARARRCSASTPPTCAGCSRTWSRAGSSNRITVDDDHGRAGARVALDRMLAIT